MIAVIIGCAEVGPPPGGAEDKAGPIILGSEPAHGALGVASRGQVNIYFSEKVDKPTTGSGILISPRPADEPDIKWHNDWVEIKLKDSLLPDRTYMFAISSTVRDYRGNPLDSNAVIAFSTGETIDSGTIGGTVTRGAAPAPGLTVALYEISSADADVDYDSTFSDYLTETTRDGGFKFQFLPPRRYRLVAFSDRNDDGRFNPLSEPYALPDREIIVGGVLPLEQLSLSMTAADTTTATIVGADFAPNNLIRLRFNRSLDLSYLADNPTAARLINKADSSAIPVLGVREARDSSATSATLYCGVIPEGSYRIEFPHDSSAAMLSYDSVIVRPTDDNTAPLLLATLPAVGSYFVDEVDIRLQLSEPYQIDRLSDQSFALFAGDSIPKPLEFEQLDPFWLRLKPIELLGGVDYRIMISQFDIVDLAGNVLGDSLQEFSFRTLNPDSLGWISGTASILLPERTDQPIVITARSASSNQTFEQVTTDGSFKLEVPGGRYLLSGFIDTDGDGTLSPGSIDPLRLAEPVATLRDTVRVRPRFETSSNVLTFR